METTEYDGHYNSIKKVISVFLTNEFLCVLQSAKAKNWNIERVWILYSVMATSR